MAKAAWVRSGYVLPLVDVAARANPVNQQGSIVQIGKEHSPVADSKAVLNILSALVVSNIASAFLDQKFDRADDPLLRWPIEAEELLLGSLGPFNTAAHSASLSSRLISSWDTVSPLACSLRPSRIAARSSSVRGSSSSGAASRARCKGSAVCRRYSRYRRAAGSSGSGNSSTNV